MAVMLEAKAFNEGTSILVIATVFGKSAKVLVAIL
jgi:hypothetical protein